jgi:predicted DCC family thiol-disulfide oxidoreductase YuxK
MSVDRVPGGSELATRAKGVTPPIIFFDGVCGMCNRFVDLVLRVDRKELFRFAPLQGTTARELLPPLHEDPQQWSMVYLDERGRHDQSDASLEVYRRLGGAWHVLGLLRFVPRALRNPVYRVVARNRYRWFGKQDTCRVPSPEERRRFLP